MSTKKLRNSILIISLLSSLFLTIKTAEAADLGCVDLFHSLEQSQNRFFSFLPRFISERNQRAIVRLAKRDSRLAILRLNEASTIIDRLDNFSSPALIKNFVLGRKAPVEFEQYLKKAGSNSYSISKAIIATREIPPHIRIFFDLIESRYRTAVEILGMAYAIKTNTKLSLQPSEYAHHLIEALRDSVVEISKNGKYHHYFEGFDLRSLDWNKIAESVESSLSGHPLFSYTGPLNKPIFRSHFLESMNVDRSLPQLMSEMGMVLDRQLSTLPVGISYRVAEFTSTVRFGDKHFYGNWFNFTSTDRAAYLRYGKKLGGIMEVELKVSNHKKKMMAVLLDRSHKNLDPVFSLENKTGRCFNTCGSFAPILFMRSGVPIISPGYATPSTSIASLALQKFLGFNNVEAVRFSDLSPVGAAIDVPIILIHDVNLTKYEIGFYMATLSSTGSVLYSLF